MTAPAPDIMIGTSGYSFRDWRGTFYPQNLNQSGWLPYYAQHFPAVEINMTYYRIPPPDVFRNMLKKVPPEFQFVVKANQGTTHTRKTDNPALSELIHALEPFRDTGQLAGLLAQFPYSFHNTEANRVYLAGQARILSDDIPLFVEFRHSSWARSQVYDFLKVLDIGYVNVDGPQLGMLLPPQHIVTTSTAYFRLHGRNAETWWNPEQGDRYDYHYSASELLEWRDNLLAVQGLIKKAYVFFNNCHHGHASQNALEFKTLLGTE